MRTRMDATDPVGAGAEASVPVRRQDRLVTGRYPALMSTEAAPASRGVRLPRTQRRAQLLGAARTVFVENGYHAAGMDDIADRAGVSKPVLYQHFPGKLDLYLALLDESSNELVAQVADALASPHDNRDRVDALISAYFSFVGEPASAFRLLFDSDLTMDPSVRSRIDEVNVRCAGLVAEVIAEETDLPADEAQLLGFGLIGLAQTAARAWLVFGHASVPRPDAEARAAALAWRGLSGFPRSGEIPPA
jgi:AcrR family transcriptional regulator